MLELPSALEERNVGKLDFSRQKVCCSSSKCPYFSAVTVHLDAHHCGSTVPTLSGTIAHELRVFCYEGTPHQSSGEYSFH